MKVEDEYMDVLQNIETAIVTAYESDPTLVDADVLDALEGLIRSYDREDRGRAYQAPWLSARAQPIYSLARSMCEWRLGRQSHDGAHDGYRPPTDELSISNIVRCLKRIRKSVRFWKKQGGRQGYLEYVSQFVGEAAGGLGT